MNLDKFYLNGNDFAWKTIRYLYFGLLLIAIWYEMWPGFAHKIY